MRRIPTGTEILNEVSDTAYRIHAYLGEGGFGAVYGAYRIDVDGDEFGDPVCLKVTADAEAWHGEAFFGGLLRDSSNVVRQIDAFPTKLVEAGRKRMVFMIVMQYVETGTVRDACLDGRLPWPEDRVARKIRGLLKPLALLHQMGATHRDITPANVFVGERATLRLGDFGIARVGLTKRGGPVLALAPPFAPFDLTTFWRPADDVYQVGLLMMTLLAGEEITNDYGKVAVNRLTSRDRGLRAVIKAAIDVKSRRPQSAHDLLVALS